MNSDMHRVSPPSIINKIQLSFDHYYALFDEQHALSFDRYTFSFPVYGNEQVQEPSISREIVKLCRNKFDQHSLKWLKYLYIYIYRSLSSAQSGFGHRGFAIRVTDHLWILGGNRGNLIRTRLTSGIMNILLRAILQALVEKTTWKLLWYCCCSLLQNLREGSRKEINHQIKNGDFSIFLAIRSDHHDRLFRRHKGHRLWNSSSQNGSIDPVQLIDCLHHLLL